MGNTRARHELGTLNTDATITPHEEAHWMARAMSLDASPVSVYCCVPLPAFSIVRQPKATTTKNPVNGISRQLEASKTNKETLLDTGVEVGGRCGGGLSKELLSVVPVYVTVTFGGTDFVLRMAMKTYASIWLSEMHDPSLTSRSS